jgi:serine/threonine protein kinase
VRQRVFAFLIIHKIFILHCILSILASSNASKVISLHTASIGTPSYAAPEQISGGVYGASADIYSLGLVFVELLTPVHSGMERAVMFSGQLDIRFENSFMADFCVVY